MSIDRPEVARCLAKAIAAAHDWARRLVRALQCAEILRGAQ